jgi:NADP-dependent 3-hydroxy acid dehydrogenase YdfG
LKASILLISPKIDVLITMPWQRLFRFYSKWQLEDWDAMIDINVKGLYMFRKHNSENDRTKSSIINIGSYRPEKKYILPEMCTALQNMPSLNVKLSCE